MKHYLLKNEEDRWNLCWKFLQFKYGEVKIWKDEDEHLLKPFFKYHSLRGEAMTPEERVSFDHYKMYMKSYAQALFNIRDSVENFEMDDILEAFGYVYEEADEEVDEDGNVGNPFSETHSPPSHKEDLKLEYPCVAVVWIESDFDRFGRNGVCCVDFIEQKEFKE